MSEDRAGSWPALRRVLAALGLHPLFAFDADKRRALSELREVLDEVDRLRARVAALERMPAPAVIETLVAGDTVPTLGAYRVEVDREPPRTVRPEALAILTEGEK